MVHGKWFSAEEDPPQVGQIVLLARHSAGEEWESLSVPRGKSNDFNAAMREKHGDWTKGTS